MISKSTLFITESLGNAIPFFGPLPGGEGQRVVLSTACLHLEPNIEYHALFWIFDEDGNLRYEKRVPGCFRRQPISFDLSELMPESSSIRGMVGVALCPQAVIEPPPTHSEAWTVRFIAKSGLKETVVSEGPPRLNRHDPSGRRSRFRLISGALLSDPNWRSLVAVSNASIDPNYRETLEIEITVRNGQGQALESMNYSVPAFGTKWLDLEEVFGSELEVLLKASESRGSYIITSNNGGAIGYHFLFRSDTGDLAGDHTRAMLPYLLSGYGTSRYSIDKSKVFYFQAILQNIIARITRMHINIGSHNSNKDLP